MPKQGWAILTCMLLLGAAAPSQAAPPDPPISQHANEPPCNGLCRLYHRLSSLFGRAAPPQTQTARLAHPTAAARATGAPGDRSKPAGSRPAANAIATAASAAAGSPPKASAADVSQPGTEEEQVTAAGEGSKPEAAAPVAMQAAAALKGHRSASAGSQPAANANNRNRPHAADAARAAANSGTRTTEPRVAAASPTAARAATAITASVLKANQMPGNVDALKRPETSVPSEAEKVTSVSPSATEVMVVLLMTRPEFKSVSDLANQRVAIDYWQSASIESVRTAIAAAGATGIQLSTVQTDAINMLINGEERAVVLTLMSPEAAKGFPDIAGFSIFRIPLAPASPKAAVGVAPRQSAARR